MAKTSITRHYFSLIYYREFGVGAGVSGSRVPYKYGSSATGLSFHAFYSCSCMVYFSLRGFPPVNEMFMNMTHILLICLRKCEFMFTDRIIHRNNIRRYVFNTVNASIGKNKFSIWSSRRKIAVKHKNKSRFHLFLLS